MKFVQLIIILFVWQTALYAQDNQDFKREKGYFSVGINPTYPFLGGYGVKVFYNLPKGFSFGLASERVSKLPEIVEKQFFNNAEAIDVNWDYSIGTEIRYRFNNSNDIKGLYAFTTLGYEKWTVNKAPELATVTNTPQSQIIENWYTSAGLGYNFFPIKNKGLWIGAAYNVIFLLNNTEDKIVNNTTFNHRSIVPPSFIPNIYVGWRF